MRDLLEPLGDRGLPAALTAERQVVALGPSVHEHRLRLTATAATDVDRADALHARLRGDGWASLSFRSSWAAEFEPVRGSGPLSLESRAGRSSHGAHPWLGLECRGAAVIVCPAWSGNWHIRLTSDGVLSAGISPWRFRVQVTPDRPFDAPPVVVATGEDLETAAAALTTAVANTYVPRSPASERIGVEWNHWWPYEDVEIDEAVFLQNARYAAHLGFDVCTLDAGWFGRADAASRWPEERGDWDQVNLARFPRGLTPPAHEVARLGMDFGIWLEAEAVGAGSRLRTERPDVLATRSEPATDGAEPVTVSLDPDDPTFLGYVCLGSPAGRELAAGQLDRLVHETGARWLKLDFNVDPGAGCDRLDHGHGRHDGLLRHYEGLYAVLDEFRDRHPEVVLESCSSGGLRLDLGMARHVHCQFLSDADWTEHHLQVLWGASLMLPPVAMLHWSWSQWRGEHPRQTRDVARMDADEFDATLRAAMVHRPGVSLRLPELPETLAARLAAHLEAFRTTVAPFVRGGVLRRLTAAPRRGGGGERVPAFQLDLAGRHVVLVVALDGPTDSRAVPVGLDPLGRYRVTPLAEAAEPWVVPGAEVTVPLVHARSRLVLIEPAYRD